MVTTPQQVVAAEHLLETPGLGPCELVRGELIMMTPGGFDHGSIANIVGYYLTGFVIEHGLGTITGAETGFQIGHDPDTVRAPDVGFVRADRVPSGPTPGFFQGPPDLAVEVLSPGDRAGEVLDKVQQWLDAGCQVVWLIDPQRRTAAVYRVGEQTVLHNKDDELTGGDLLPGFRLRLADIFGG
ncbi:MAG: Uma2 family endonuclease [Candidatus Nealsonbacteria bacterium]|nr:Uma2 family endonuclease [Candidatus Nealsonbacteria bacterium]